MDGKARPHRVTYSATLGKIPAYNRHDARTLMDAWQAYISAKVAFDTTNTDDTMIGLIGSYARFTRIVNEMEKKYG